MTFDEAVKYLQDRFDLSVMQDGACPEEVVDCEGYRVCIGASSKVSEALVAILDHVLEPR